MAYDPHDAPSDHVDPVRSTMAVISTVVVVAAVAVAILLITTVASSTIPFDSDEANHAADGWQVYHALINLAPGELAKAVTDQAFYPPVHSFVVAAGYLVAGPSLASSRLPTVAIFVLTLLALAWLTLRVARRAVAPASSLTWLPIAGVTLAVALAITSQVFLIHAVLVMLEMTGALLGLLLLLIVDWVDGTAPGRRRWSGLVAAACMSMVVFMAKYSFGLYYVPGLAAALVSASWPWKASRRAWYEAAVVGAICAVLFGLWLILTDRPTMLLFVTDHRRDAPLLSLQNLLFLPRVWFERYATTGLLALIVTLLALIGAIRQWQQLAVRVAVWSIVALLVSLTISRVHEARNLVPVAPAAWMLAGLGLVEVLRWLYERTGAKVVVAAVVGLFAVIAFGAVSLAASLRADLVIAFEGVPALGQVEDYALQQVDLEQPVLMIGDFSDRIGLMAIRWRAGTLSAKNLWDLNVDYFPYEYFEHPMRRTHRKPQQATVDPALAHEFMDDVLAWGYYASVVEVKHKAGYFGPRAANPDDPLCGYAATEKWFDDWVVTVYDIAAGQKKCL